MLLEKSEAKRKQVEEALKSSSLTIETSMSAIFIADIKCIITYTNISTAKMWGYKNTGEIVNTNAVEYWTESTRGKAEEVIRTLLTKVNAVTYGELKKN